MSNIDLYAKACKVIDSCETLKQLSVARKYIKLLDFGIGQVILDPHSPVGFDDPSIALYMRSYRKKVQLMGHYEDEGVEEHW